MKIRFLISGVVVFVAGIVLLSCSSLRNGPRESARRSYANPLPITILHTNDVHGHAWEQKARDGILRGGFPAQAALVDKIWQEVDERGGVTFILSAGDVNTGVPESDLLNAKPDFVAMNRIGYDAMVLGNHEFDHGLGIVERQKGWAGFPFLSANVLYRNGTAVAEPYRIFHRGGVKVGVLGLTTADLKTLVLDKYVSGLKVQSPIEVSKRTIPEMKEQGAEVIIALTHLGLNDPISAGLSSNTVDDRALAEAVPEIDVVIGGHTDTLLRAGINVNGTLLAQAGGKGHFLGRVDLLWDREAGKIIESKASVIPVLPANGKNVALEKTLNEFKEQAGVELAKVVANASVPLDGKREHVRNQETNLGNLICDALKSFTKSDVAIYNGGGIRAEIEQGDVTIRDVYRVLPFGNTAVTADVSGAQLVEALNIGIQNRYPHGSFLQVSGVQYEIANGRARNVRVLGKPIRSKKTYRLATNNFILTGGDKYKVLTKTKNQRDTGLTVADVFAQYLAENKTVSPSLEGRIRDRGAPSQVVGE